PSKGVETPSDRPPNTERPPPASRLRIRRLRKSFAGQAAKRRPRQTPSGGAFLARFTGLWESPVGVADRLTTRARSRSQPEWSRDLRAIERARLPIHQSAFAIDVLDAEVRLRHRTQIRFTCPVYTRSSCDASFAGLRIPVGYSALTKPTVAFDRSV